VRNRIPVLTISSGAKGLCRPKKSLGSTFPRPAVCAGLLGTSIVKREANALALLSPGADRTFLLGDQAMNRASYALTVLLLLAAMPLVSGHGAEPKKVSEIMQKKLKHSQTVLEGLAIKDFKKISKSADELFFLTKEEEWKVLRTVDYENYSNEFRRNVQALMKNAKDENLDGCALSYVDMTLTCVKYHKHVREVRMGRLPSLPRGSQLGER
jgi:hypothetical protein